MNDVSPDWSRNLRLFRQRSDKVADTTEVHRIARRMTAAVVLLLLGALGGSWQLYQVQQRADALVVSNRRQATTINQLVQVQQSLLQAVEAQAVGFHDQTQVAIAATRDSEEASIADLRLSMDCVVLWALDRRPGLCSEVDARLDLLGAGGMPIFLTPRASEPASAVVAPLGPLVPVTPLVPPGAPVVPPTVAPTTSSTLVCTISALGICVLPHP